MGNGTSGDSLVREPSNCWKVNFKTGMISVIDDLTTCRSHFGLCATRCHIYVVGGQEGAESGTTERFNLLTKKWTSLDCEIPEESCNRITLEVAKKRYIYGFGQKK